MHYEYSREGVCSRQIILETDDENNTIKSVKFVGGCPGNTVGVAKLCEGRTINEVIELLKGTPCGFRGTSCPDQLARALEKIKEENNKKI